MTGKCVKPGRRWAAGAAILAAGLDKLDSALPGIEKGTAELCGGKVEFLLQSDSIKAPASDTVKTAQSDVTETQADQRGKNIFGMIGDFFKNLFGIK